MNDAIAFAKWMNEPIYRFSEDGRWRFQQRCIAQHPDCTTYLIIDENGNKVNPDGIYYTIDELYAIYREKHDTLPDLSWMFHCTSNPKCMVDYNGITNDKDIANMCNIAVGLGGRYILRMMEDLRIIQLGDLDRSPTPADEQKWQQALPDKK